MALQTWFRAVTDFAHRNSTTILTALSVAGVFTTAVLAMNGKTKADELMRIEKEERRLEAEYYGEEPRAITPLEYVQHTWHCYIPVTASAIATSACIIGLNRVHTRHYAAISALYGATTATLREYQDRTAEKLGPRKEHAIRDEVSASRIEKNPPTANNVVQTKYGDVLFYDSLAKEYFRSDIETVRKTVNDMNHQMLTDTGYITLNEFYRALGVPDQHFAYQIGFEAHRNQLEIEFSTHSYNGEPCFVIEYLSYPRNIWKKEGLW